MGKKMSNRRKRVHGSISRWNAHGAADVPFPMLDVEETRAQWQTLMKLSLRSREHWGAFECELTRQAVRTYTPDELAAMRFPVRDRKERSLWGGSKRLRTLPLLHRLCYNTYAVSPMHLLLEVAHRLPVHAIDATTDGEDSDATTALHEVCMNTCHDRAVFWTFDDACETGDDEAARKPASVQLAEFLLRNMSYSSVFHRDKHGHTALHVACAMRRGAVRRSLVETLLRYGHPYMATGPMSLWWTSLGDEPSWSAGDGTEHRKWMDRRFSTSPLYAACLASSSPDARLIARLLDHLGDPGNYEAQWIVFDRARRDWCADSPLGHLVLAGDATAPLVARLLSYLPAADGLLYDKWRASDEPTILDRYLRFDCACPHVASLLLAHMPDEALRPRTTWDRNIMVDFRAKCSLLHDVCSRMWTRDPNAIFIRALLARMTDEEVQARDGNEYWSNGITALSQLCSRERTERLGPAVDLLLARMCDSAVASKTHKGDTILHTLAAFYDPRDHDERRSGGDQGTVRLRPRVAHAPVLRRVVERIAACGRRDVFNECDTSGNTPLHLALRRTAQHCTPDDLECVDILMQHTFWTDKWCGVRHARIGYSFEETFENMDRQEQGVGDHPATVYTVLHAWIRHARCPEYDIGRVLWNSAHSKWSAFPSRALFNHHWFGVERPRRLLRYLVLLTGPCEISDGNGNGGHGGDRESGSRTAVTARSMFSFSWVSPVWATLLSYLVDTDFVRPPPGLPDPWLHRWLGKTTSTMDEIWAPYTGVLYERTMTALDSAVAFVRGDSGGAASVNASGAGPSVSPVEDWFVGPHEIHTFNVPTAGLQALRNVCRRRYGLPPLSLPVTSTGTRKRKSNARDGV